MANLPYTAGAASPGKDPLAPKDANPFQNFSQPMGTPSNPNSPAPLGAGANWVTDPSSKVTPTLFTPEQISGASQMGGAVMGAENAFHTHQANQANELPMNIAPVAVAQTRTGIAGEVAPDLNSVASNLYKPNLNVAGSNIDLNTQGNKYGIDTNSLYSTSMDPNYNAAYAAKANLGMNDFGIPAAIQDKMKTAEAQTIGHGYDVQQEAAKRLLARAGLTNDSASTKMASDIGQAKMGDISRSYNNIDVQSAIQANQQHMQNLQDLLSSSTQASQLENSAKSGVMSNLLGQEQLGEQSRQFNVGGEMDMGRLDRATQQWMEQAGMNRTQLNESIAEYLQNLDLERQKAAAGLVGSAPQSAASRLNELQTAFGSVPATGGFGGFSSGTSGLGA